MALLIDVVEWQPSLSGSDGVPLVHLVRFGMHSNRKALRERRAAAFDEPILLAADPDQTEDETGFVTLAAPPEFCMSDWIDPRRIGEDKPMLTPAAARALARLALPAIARSVRPALKLIISDLDGVMWGGVLGEDGMNGLDFAGGYATYRGRLAELIREGMLVAVVSRNRLDDVERLFSTRDILGICRDDLVALEASWQPKADVIQALLERLNVASEAAVFIDDDPLERGLAAASIPGLVVVEDGDRPAAALQDIERKHRFATAGTEEDAKRTASLLAGQRFAQELKSFSNRSDLLHALDMQLAFEDLDDANRSRACQLIERVTQFRTGPSPAGWNAEPYRVFLASLLEGATDHGRVGLVVWHPEGMDAIIDLVCLSCRAFGRDVETALLAETARRATDEGRIWLTGRFTPTVRNDPARDLFARHAFEEVAPSSYRRMAAGVTLPSHFRLISKESRYDHR